jgi:hypothetical protein
MSLTSFEPVDLRCEYGTCTSVWMALHYFDRHHLVSSLQFLQGIPPLVNFWDFGRPLEHNIAVKYYLFQVHERGIGLRLRRYP